jgi:hypothetical protein
MKNLENYGVQELGAKEKVEIGGGYSVTSWSKNTDGTYTQTTNYYHVGCNTPYNTTTTIVNSLPPRIANAIK